MILLVEISLCAFNGAEVNPFGVVSLPVYAANRVLEVKFVAMDTPSAINVIIGRKWIHAVKGVVST